MFSENFQEKIFLEKISKKKEDFDIQFEERKNITIFGWWWFFFFVDNFKYATPLNKTKRAKVMLDFKNFKNLK